MNKTIKLDDGLEVEVEVDENQSCEISDGEVVKSSIDNIQAILAKVIQPVSNTYRELDKDMNIESAKVAVGIKIGVEGNVIIAKSKTEAHIQVELTLRTRNA